MKQDPDMRFDHLGVLAKDIAAGRPHLAAVFGVREWTEVFSDPVHQVRVQFGRDPSGVVYELIEPLGDTSPVAGALAKGQNILNHVAYRVTDLELTAEALREKRCLPLGPAAPAVAFNGQPIQFFLTPLRIILEIIQGQTHDHKFSPRTY